MRLKLLEVLLELNLDRVTSITGFAFIIELVFLNGSDNTNSMEVKIESLSSVNRSM
jgi:hypothetical protein